MTDKRNIESSFSFTIGSSFVLALTKIRRPKVSNIYFLEDYTVSMSQSYPSQGIPRKPENGSVSNSFIVYYEPNIIFVHFNLDYTRVPRY